MNLLNFTDLQDKFLAWLSDGEEQIYLATDENDVAAFDNLEKCI